MSLQAVISDHLDRLESVPNTFLSMTAKQNEQLWKELLVLLEGLEVKDGVILSNASNLAKSQEITQRLQQVMFSGDYLEGLKGFIGQFDSQAGMVNEIFAGRFDDFVSDSSMYKAIINQSKKTTLALFDQTAIDKAWAEPMRRIMQDNILVKGTYNDLVGVLKDYVLGSPEREAALSRYVSLYARDSFNIYNRTYTHFLAEDIGAEFYEYVGGQVEDSRDFCIARAGRKFSKKEVQSWANLSWQGKNPSTTEATIFEYAGGYNCMHSILPVDKEEAGGAFFNEVRSKSEVEQRIAAQKNK